MTQTLEDLLAYLAADGHRDSGGTFTLDLDKAPDQFRALQRQQPALWFILLVRAAGLWGAARVDARMRGEVVQIDIPVAPEGVSAALQEEGIWSAWSHPQVGLVTLAVAALRAARPLALTFTFFETQEQLEVEPGDVEGLSAPPTQGMRILVKSRLDAKFTTEMRERLRYCATPIYWDGHLINQPLVHKAWVFPDRVKSDLEPGLRRDFVQRVWLLAAPPADLLALADPLDEFAQRYLVNGRLLSGTAGSINLQQWCVPEEGKLKAEITSGGGGGRSSPLRWKVSPPTRFDFPIETGWVDAFFGGQKSRRAIGAGALLRWGRRNRGKGHIFPVHQGVLLDPLELEPQFEGCWAFVAVPQLHTDLSQYRLVRDEACEALRDWVQEQFTDMGATLQQLLDQGQSEALGLRFNSFLAEARAAAERFQSWSKQGWGDPNSDR